jgi:phosphatidylserine/phosphatidylglycerophosphate/cardiolipin synthase-like enzyme
VKVIAGTRRKTDPTQPLQPLDVNNEVSLSILGALGVPVAFHQDARYGSSHRKYVLVDERYSLVGSHNWTEGSVSKYRELSVVVQSRKVAAAYGKALDRRHAAAQARERVSG